MSKLSASTHTKNTTTKTLLEALKASRAYLNTLLDHIGEYARDDGIIEQIDRALVEAELENAKATNENDISSEGFFDYVDLSLEICRAYNRQVESDDLGSNPLILDVLLKAATARLKKLTTEIEKVAGRITIFYEQSAYEVSAFEGEILRIEIEKGGAA